MILGWCFCNQFMPRTTRNYAIDYNNNKSIELKNIEDFFASAKLSKNRLENKLCFFKVELKIIFQKIS